MAHAILLMLVLAAAVRPLDGETAQTAPRATRMPASKTEPATIKCPSTLGVGVRTGKVFCDVMTGRQPSDGVVVVIPPHAGSAILSFDLHNRHTYSEEQVRSGRAYARYTATVGVLTANNDLLSRGVVQSEFRTAADLLDRIAGGAGPGGVKAVAPTGTESIVVTIPDKMTEVSIVGEKLTVNRLDGISTYAAPDRPIAVVSNVIVEYRAPPPPPARRSRQK